MIDIHHHCLPGVDDGPQEWDEAVAMCRMAADEGIETIVATPHVLCGRWRSMGRDELESRIEMLREKTGNTPRLLLGSEYFFAHDMAEVLQAGNAIVPLAGSRYPLVELAANKVPPMIEQPLYRSQLDGWIPIIVHPERNFVLQSRPEMVVELIEHGARMQITAGSLTGEFGAAAQQCAHAWVKQGLVHFVANGCAQHIETAAPRSGRDRRSEGSGGPRRRRGAHSPKSAGRGRKSGSGVRTGARPACRWRIIDAFARVFRTQTGRKSSSP